MTQPLYDIYFTGQLVDGTDQETAQKNLAQLFKANVGSLSRLFNGKPQILKRGVNKEGALKYKAALHKAGLLVAFKAHQVIKETTAEQALNQGQSSSNSTAPNQAFATSFTLAPVGSNVLNDDEKQIVEAPQINTDDIKLVSAFADLSAPEKQYPPAPDTSHISLAEAGEDLLVEQRELPPPLELDLDAISIAPAGADLEQLHDDTPPVTPNISGISIAPAGADLMPNPSKKKPALPPNTDHISIVQE